jgi:hypothetical protein
MGTRMKVARNQKCKFCDSCEMDYRVRTRDYRCKMCKQSNPVMKDRMEVVNGGQGIAQT